VNGRQVAFMWNAGANTTDYVLEAGSAPGLTNIASLPVGGSSLTVLAPPGTYYVRVRPRNGCGSGLPSNEVLVTVS
jgi:hypothetical protein